MKIERVVFRSITVTKIKVRKYPSEKELNSEKSESEKTQS